MMVYKMKAHNKCDHQLKTYNDHITQFKYDKRSTENVMWMNITNDRISFVDEEGQPSAKCTVNSDSIMMYFEGVTQKSKFWFAQDTLFNDSETGRSIIF